MRLRLVRLVCASRPNPFYLSRRRFGSCACLASFGGVRRRPLIESTHCGANAAPVIRVPEHKQGRRFFVSGRVQGVGYRFFACDAAQRQGVGGYARNLRDGRVEVYAMGTEAQLRALLADLQRGPRLAWVESVSQVEAELLPQCAAQFSIEHE